MRTPLREINAGVRFPDPLGEVTSPLQRTQSKLCYSENLVGGLVPTRNQCRGSGAFSLNAPTFLLWESPSGLDKVGAKPAPTR